MVCPLPSMVYHRGRRTRRQAVDTMHREYRLLMGTFLTLGIALVWLVGVPSPPPTRAMPLLFPPRPSFTPTSAPPVRPTFTATPVLPPRPTATPTSGIPARPSSTPTSALPPRPSLTPAPIHPFQPVVPPPVGPQPAAPRSGGAYIELRLLLPQTGLPLAAGWQGLWTAVQWQDQRGKWQTVEGWQGGLDEVVSGEDGGRLGRKVWWVAQADLGKGPFHWHVYQDRTGRLLATSGPFYLPGPGVAVQWVEVTLP